MLVDHFGNGDLEGNLGPLLDGQLQYVFWRLAHL